MIGIEENRMADFTLDCACMIETYSMQINGG
jgi:hypothetical protein